MVGDLAIVCLPSVQVHVLVLATLTDAWAHIHVVERLAVHVEQVGVALDGLDADNRIKLLQTRLGSEERHGLNLGEFVKVTGSDDTGLGVFFENLSNEVLECVLAYGNTCGITN